MLKTRTFLLLIVILSTITAVGALGFFLLNNTVDGFQRVVGRDFQAIKVINDFRIMSSDLESRYLSRIADEVPPVLKEVDKLTEIRAEFDADLQELTRVSTASPFKTHERQVIAQLDESVKNYLGEFDQIISADFAKLPRSERAVARREILEASYAMADSVENALAILENSVSQQRNEAEQQVNRSFMWIWVATMLAILFLIIGYHLVIRKFISPLSELTNSLREVQKQDFNRVLPVVTNDEVGELSAAFNDMSAELRVMKLESDQKFIQLNRERGAIIKGFPHPIYMLDVEGNLNQSNPAAELLSENLRTKTGEIPSKVKAAVQECISTRTEFLPDDITEAVLFRVDEREVWYLPRIFQIRAEPEDEKITGWAVVLINVTQVRWMDDMKNDLIGTVSHEIKTPLTSIRMILHLLAEQKTGDLNAKQQRMVDSAKDDCERLLETLENILSLSKMTNGGSQLELAPEIPSQLISEVVEIFGSSSTIDRSLSLKTDVEGDLPPVLVDRTQIEHVLDNFLSNAISHSPSNHEITVSAKKTLGNFIRFAIVDHGEGIAENEQDKIFDRFYKGSGDKNSKLNRGLGLWISREIIRAHHGRIGVESAPGEPTEFFFEIPQSH